MLPLQFHVNLLLKDEATWFKGQEWIELAGPQFSRSCTLEHLWYIYIYGINEYHHHSASHITSIITTFIYDRPFVFENSPRVWNSALSQPQVTPRKENSLKLYLPIRLYGLVHRDSDNALILGFKISKDARTNGEIHCHSHRCFPGS